MKSFATIVTLASLLFCLFSCDEGKSGPFTFTNNTGTTVYVLIDQDGVLEKTFTDEEKYQGKDYFTPKITFVKGFDPAENKTIVDNKYTASSTNGFDYSFNLAEGTAINIIVDLQEELPTELTGCYLAEAQGKLGEYSKPETPNTYILTTLAQQLTTDTIYTNTPHFRIYDNAKQDVTNLFTIAVEKSELPPVAPETSPTVQWNLKITYPKVEVVQN